MAIGISYPKHFRRSHRCPNNLKARYARAATTRPGTTRLKLALPNLGATTRGRAGRDPHSDGRVTQWRTSGACRVAYREAAMQTVDSPSPLRAGWLDKLPVSLSLMQAWRRRWITLHSDRLSWARDSTSAPLGELPLGVRGAAGRIEVRQRRLVVHGSDGRKLVLRGSDDDLREWSATLEKCMGHAPSLNLTSLADGASPHRSAMQVELSSLDEQLVQALGGGHIRLLRVSWLLAQPDNYRIQRRQELEELETSGGEQPLLRPEEAAALVRRGDRSAGALTYGWLCPGEPDPAGARGELVRIALEENTHIEGLFWE